MKITIGETEYNSKDKKSFETLKKIKESSKFEIQEPLREFFLYMIYEKGLTPKEFGEAMVATMTKNYLTEVESELDAHLRSLSF